MFHIYPIKTIHCYDCFAQFIIIPLISVTYLLQGETCWEWKLANTEFQKFKVVQLSFQYQLNSHMIAQLSLSLTQLRQNLYLLSNLKLSWTLCIQFDRFMLKYIKQEWNKSICISIPSSKGGIVTNCGRFTAVYYS